MTPDFHDSIYHEARRNYTPSMRSWHIPADSEYRRPTFLLVIAALLVFGCIVWGALL